MGYQFKADEAIADVAFEADGATKETMFISAAEATLNTMVDSLDSVLPRETRLLTVKNAELDLLLFDFLNELLYLKDADGLLLRVSEVEIRANLEEYEMTAITRGECLDPARHEQRADVKAVTLHKLNVEKTHEGWRCFVILDV